jgi:chromosome segregation protein
VRIERLTLAGFKSFGDRVTVEFAPGVTAIVGPNGSGKSNLLDALRWATGGGRAREFRAGEKTELIFHGAAGKKRLGRAEVEVELRTGERRLRIRRSLDRDGVTKLTLNGRAARFLDLDEELAGSGLGRGSLAVIGQGEISGVLMADPGRLLSYVAEAAGAARLAARREQTEARLEAARGHLDRLEERLADDRERLEALRRDADEAQRHERLTARARRLRRTLAEAKAVGLRRETAKLREEVARLEGGLREGREAAATLRAELAQVREADAAAEAAHREATAAHAQAAAELRVAEHALEAATTRAGDVERQRERLEAERAALEALPEPEPPQDDLAPLRAEAQASEAALDAARQRVRTADAGAERAREARERLEAEAARADRAAAQAEAERAALERQRDEVVAQLAERGAEAGEAGAAADAASEREPAHEEEERAAEAALAEAEEALEAARARLEAAQAAHAREAAEARALERAAERQRAALAARRGYAEGPRHALTSGIDGVLGSVADVIRVPAELQEAIQLALGRRAEVVLCRDADVARRVLAHVRRQGGWVTLLPLDLVRADAPRPAPELDGAPGVIGRASAEVETAARFRPAIDQLLGGTVLVETTARATELARELRRRPRLVSLEGDVLEPGGALSGGRRQGRSPVVGAAADLEEAEAHRDEAHGRERSAAAEVGAAQAAFVTAREAVDAARQRAASTRAEAARWRERRAAEARWTRELRERRGRIEAALAELPAPPEPVAPERLEAARAADADARRAAQEARGEETPAAEAAARAARALALAEERRRAYDAAKARYDQDAARAEQAGQEAERLGEAGEAAWAAVREAEGRAQRARSAMPDPDDLQRRQADRETARAELRAAEAALEAAGERQTERAEALERARVQLARREASLEAAEAERDAFPAGLEPLELGERAARAELRDVEEALEAIGAVNHRAAQDLAALDDEHAERDREAREARDAVERLAQTLVRLDRETTERLLAAVEGVRTRFRRHVGELFGPEGEGEVEPELDGDRPVGLRIRLQPPGKRTQALGLLSVGERTMGALAFLFALMGEEQGDAGLPVAVLDEVDAPLDEANIRRYRGFLERLSAHGTQFVLITHQKATFEAADVLWGVTTEGGVSRLFSIRKEEGEAGSGPAAQASRSSPSSPRP